MRSEVADVVSSKKNNTPSLAKSPGGVGCRGDALSAGFHGCGSQSQQGGCALPGLPKWKAHVPELQVLHSDGSGSVRDDGVSNGRRHDGTWNDGSGSLPSRGRQDQPNGLLRPICSNVAREAKAGPSPDHPGAGVVRKSRSALVPTKDCFARQPRSRSTPAK
jgi:hypothetical protein